MTEPPLKIKIPAKTTADPVTKTTSRKAVKRRITSDDDASDSLSPPPKHHTKPAFKKARLSPKTELEDGSPSPPRQTSKLATGKSTSGPVTKPAKTSAKTKARIVSDEDDDDFVPELEEKSFMVSKSKMKDKGKVKASDSAKVTARNESKPPLPSASAPAGKKRLREEEDVEVDITTAPAPDDPPPKKKLPPIKKKQKTDSAATSTVASPAPVLAGTSKSASKPGASAPKPPAPPHPDLPKKPQAPVQATTMNASGTGDFDLRDSNTWRSLIGKGSSSSGPRIGIEKRVSTEERQKQLDQMRDEARLAREQKTRDTFDLQAQSRKIAAFEKKLQHDHRVKINGPHILGAAFKARPVPGMRPP